MQFCYLFGKRCYQHMFTVRTWGAISYSTAVGLFNSLINLAFLVTSNYAARKFRNTAYGKGIFDEYSCLNSSFKWQLSAHIHIDIVIDIVNSLNH